MTALLLPVVMTLSLSDVPRAAGLLRATQEIDAPDGFAALARLLPAA